MRIIISVLLVAVVLQSAFAVTSKATQAKLMVEKINNKLEKSHLGRALKNMISLATKLGYDYKDLYNALDELKNSLLTRKQSEEDLYSDQTASHNTNVQQWQSAINGYHNEIVDGENRLSNLTSELHNEEGLLEQAQEHLSNDKKQLAELESHLESLEAGYRKEIQDFENARSLIKLAVEKLNEAQQHYENAAIGGYSFAQLQNTFNSFAQKIAEGTSNLASKHQLFVKPVIQAMTQIKSSTDQSSIQLAVNALNDLQAYFDRALNDATTIYLQVKAYLESSIETLKGQITLYEETVIPHHEENISLLKTQIQQTQDALALSNANHASSVQSLADENESFSKITARHEALVSRILNEYDLVIQAEKILRTAEANLAAL